MEENLTRELYYVRGAEGHGKEVINALIEKGAKNINHLEGDDANYLYYINHGIINYCDTGDQLSKDLYNIITQYGTELIVEHKQIIKWDDITKEEGYYLDGVEPQHTKYETIGDIKISNDLFATLQIAKSVQAVAMISQIREQGKATYGGVPAHTACAYIIELNSYGDPVIKHLYYCGGLLRFNTDRQAKMFLDNNKELVEEYLKTF